jgi:large subunit ribosomal protein L3
MNNMKVLLGKKIEMTQIFREDGSVVPVTLVQAGPCTVTTVKTQPNGQKAVVLGYGNAKHVNKAQRDDWKDLGKFSDLLEVAVDESSTLERGSVLDVSVFELGDVIDVTGTSKGKGFQGVVKRHGFHGSPKSHGHKDQMRMPGSIGAGGPQRVFKGMRMGGRMGGDQVTVKNLEIVQVDQANNIIAVKGALPGARGSVVAVRSTKGTIWQK